MKKAQFYLCCLLLITPLIGAAHQKSCFSEVTYVTPEKQVAMRALYVLVDETMPLSAGMKKKISALIQGWGVPGDKVKIARFSASYRGLYPELVYENYVEQKPGDHYMFNLHYRDKKLVTQCLEQQQAQFKQSFAKQIKISLEAVNPKIPKSEIFSSLRLLSKQIVLHDDAQQKTVLLISDGLENSELTSFYSGGKVKLVKPLKEIAQLRRKGMMGFWKKTNIYMYGLGLMPDKKQYAGPERIESLKRFWERYFVESGAKVQAIGTPELLLTAIE